MVLVASLQKNQFSSGLFLSSSPSSSLPRHLSYSSQRTLSNRNSETHHDDNEPTNHSQYIQTQWWWSCVRNQETHITQIQIQIRKTRILKQASKRIENPDSKSSNKNKILNTACGWTDLFSVTKAWLWKSEKWRNRLFSSNSNPGRESHNSWCDLIFSSEREMNNEEGSERNREGSCANCAMSF